MERKKCQGFVYALLIVAFLFSCRAWDQAKHSCKGCSKVPASYEAFDSDLPGIEPKIFAASLIAPSNEYVGYCAFSPDGNELYYAQTNDQWSVSRIIRISANDLTRKELLLLKDNRYEGEPFLTRDGNTMYFMAVLPPKNGQMWHADQYRATRNSDGWCRVERLDSIINTAASEWHVTVTDSNIVYFTSERLEGTSALHGDIYRAEVYDNTFRNCVKLPAPINSDFNDSDPLIAPDESFLIFHSNRPGGFGEHDLYVAFRENGIWSNPVNMGPKINSNGWEMAPTLTPDGKYLLYTHRDALVTHVPSRIWWVSTSVLEKYRK